MRFYSDYCKYVNIVFLTLRNSLSLSINYNHTNVQNTCYFILLRINMYFNIYLTDNLVLILSIIISSLILLVNFIKLNFPVKN